jgi:hypothetical protein
VSKVNPDIQAARIAHTVGKKKRVQIIAEARKLSIVVLNAKEVKAPAKEEAKEEAKPAEAKEKQMASDKKKEKAKKNEEKPKKAPKKAKGGAKKQ